MISLIRVGPVVSINSGACSARVYFDDLGMVSAELPIVQAGCGEFQTYSLPNVGDQVLCAFLDSGQEAGFIVGSIYSDEDKPDKSGAGLRYVKFADGGGLEYDAGASKLSIDAAGGVAITGNVSVTGNIHATGNITAAGIVQGNTP